MAATLQEDIDKLLAGSELKWSPHKEHKGGSVRLKTPGARRLFAYLLSQPVDKVVSGDEEIFPGLINAWENQEYDPAADKAEPAVIAPAGAFRLDCIETEGFGGLNLFGGAPFVLEVERQSWCLEGQNGSGKTSLASAIIWALTGRRIREHTGPILDNGSREPVFDGDGNEIGNWPPLAAYPPTPNDLRKDARVRVRLTFRDETGDEAIAEREIISKGNGTVETVKEEVDGRLLTAPQLIEAGLLMPCRLGHLNFGEKSQTLYEAVKMLTGLDQLGAVGDGAAALNHGARKFLKYAKDQRITRLESDFAKRIATATEKAKEIGLDLSKVASIDQSGIADDLKQLASVASTEASRHTATLESEVAADIDLSDVGGRRKVSDAVGAAKAAAQKATDNVRAFAVLKELHAAQVGGLFKDLPEAIVKAETELDTALQWHRRQQKDARLRLKALASQWYEVPTDPQQLALCPLCTSKLVTLEQQELATELNILKDESEVAQRRLEDVCASVRTTLNDSLPKEILRHLTTLLELEPKSAITDGAARTFTDQPPFSDILTGAATAMRTAIATGAAGLPAFSPAGQSQAIAGEPDFLAAARAFASGLRRMLELADWWASHRKTFAVYWQSLIGRCDDGEEPAADSLLGQLSKIETALASSQPYDEVATELTQAEELARRWRQVRDEQERREAIAKAIIPLKDLRLFVDAETARSIAGLSNRIGKILDRIHIKEQLVYRDTDLKKKAVYVHGSFAEGMKFDALLVANRSWLRAILWAFVLALRETTVEAMGGNAFPLLLLDDPQTTFDPRNKRNWARELARLAGLQADDPHNAQIFLTTYERQFFTFVTEFESLNGQRGLIAAANAVSGKVTIVNGNVLERIYREAEERNDDACARNYIRQVRIYIDELLKYMLQGEGPHIAEFNLERLRNELKRLREELHVAPFTRRPFGDLLKALSGGEKGIKLINAAPHLDDETIGIAQARDVQDLWKGTLRPRIHKAFHAFAAFEAFYGDPRTFDYPATVVRLPTGQREEVGKAELFRTGIAAAAKTDGRAGDGLLRIEEWTDAERVRLPNHEIYRLTASTLEPVAWVGDFVIVSNYAPVNPLNLVVAAVGERLLARRYNTSEDHPDIAILTAQAVDPYAIAEPVIVPLNGLEHRKVVGTLFSSDGGRFTAAEDEVAAVDAPGDYFHLLDQARLFEVQGRSAEPLALDRQYLMTGEPVADASAIAGLDGRLVVAVDADGATYFKRLRLKQAGLVVLESLNPDGTTPAELLSIDGRDGIPQLVQILLVLGVLFELPEQG